MVNGFWIQEIENKEKQSLGYIHDYLGASLKYDQGCQ
jgi:hypothetical protein